MRASFLNSRRSRSASVGRSSQNAARSWLLSSAVAISGDPARDPEGLRLDEAATQRLRHSMTRPAAG